MFSKILIANNGEIAVRVIRACKEMGISTVAVYSKADREALHVSLADEAYCIGGPLARDSYLNMDAILTVALAKKAEAIHPGYGFLAENPLLAKKCEENGIVFIGPPSSVIEQMGDKDMAKKTMRAAGVPVIRGCDVVGSIEEAREKASEIGLPLLIKARAGGGGRGIRPVFDSADFDRQYLAATAEAKSAFGDGAVYLEQFLHPVKHIEMQILADNFGNIVCLGERDCSMQRKNQKMIEESPSNISGAARKRMIETSIMAGRAANYRGAGTIEYLVGEDGNFYFMEMNTRLQVEHPVSEMVTGIDLVKWQIRVAAGVPLNFSENDILPSGHAIECRINAENPYDHFRVSSGKISLLHLPGGPRVRFDSAIFPGCTVSPYYDSMIGKLIVHAKTRDEAVRKMQAALCELTIEGIGHNIEFLEELLSKDAFTDSRYTTDTLLSLLPDDEPTSARRQRDDL